ncbi:MAG TPA: transcriptional repressor [Planctomycetaceae bacterium]|nr:transcriptional repressor [Planctomycetaceae bacterium]
MIHATDLPPIEVAASPTEKFQEYLATRGKRLTTERRIVLEEIFSGHEHFDREQVVERLSRRKDKRRVSRATVYRALADLEDAGLIRKVARTDGREIYEHDYGYPEHDHLICSRCKSLIEFPAESISTLLDDVAAAHGFRMTGHRLEVYGLCDECARPPRRRNPKLDLL